jgi:two-component system phosphate regulon sensor histidine kinase PhoR
MPQDVENDLLIADPLSRKLSDPIEALLSETNPLVHVLQKLGDGVVVFDLDGRVRWLNATLKRAFLIRAGAFEASQMRALTDALEALFQQLQAPPEQAATGAPLEPSVQGWQPADASRSGEWKWPSAFDLGLGRPRSFQVSLSPLELDAQNEGPEGYIALLRDITTIKTTEKMRRDFVANVSHELRTPLSILKGYAETLLEGALQQPDIAEEFVRTMQRHAVRLTSLVEDLLDLSRLEQADYQPELSPINLSGVIDRVVSLYKGHAEAKHISIILDVPSHLPPVLGNSQTLEQVVTNLLNNAIKYTPADECINLKVEPFYPRRLSSAEKDSPRFLLISIRDTGLGIEAKHIPRLFERFYRVDKARSRDLGGTGLGLSIVKHIVQVHGGNIWVESTPHPNDGHGTTFFFTLPVAQSD